jgi:hypothetical protein
VPTVLGIHDPDAVEVLLLRELVDAGDLGLVGVFEAVEIALPVVFVVVGGHIMERKAVVHITAPLP